MGLDKSKEDFKMYQTGETTHKGNNTGGGDQEESKSSLTS